jgi:hypothetical protein
MIVSIVRLPMNFSDTVKKWGVTFPMDSSSDSSFTPSEDDWASEPMLGEAAGRGCRSDVRRHCGAPRPRK